MAMDECFGLFVIMRVVNFLLCLIMIYANVGTSGILSYTKEVLSKFRIMSYVLICNHV